MLLACPNCNTVFRIEKSAIGPGRKVNCGVCKNVWIATQENLIEEKNVSENTEKIFKEKDLQLKNKISESKTKILPNEIDKQVINKPLISKEINRASEFNQKKTKIKIEKQNFRNALLWFVFGIFLSIALIGFLVTQQRNYIAAYFPKSLEIYNFFGIEFIPNLKDLEISEFIAEINGDILVIEGKISNNSFLTQLSPKIEISELNNNNEIIKVLKVSGENEIIEPKTYNYFRFELIDYDNIPKQNTNEFSAKLSSEKLILQIW